MRTPLAFNQYQQGLADGKLLGLICRDCGTVTVPPQAVCRHCSGRRLEVGELEKSGFLRTYTVIRVAPEGMTPPLIVALVETTSKAWVLGNLVGVDPDAVSMKLIGRSVTIGSRVVPADTYTAGEIRALTFELT